VPPFGRSLPRITGSPAIGERASGGEKRRRASRTRPIDDSANA
jgi:hypothetical protein